MNAALPYCGFACPQCFTNVSLATKGISSTRAEKNRKAAEMVTYGTAVKVM
jgi:hypothetical protein